MTRRAIGCFLLALGGNLRAARFDEPWTSDFREFLKALNFFIWEMNEGKLDLKKWNEVEKKFEKLKS